MFTSILLGMLVSGAVYAVEYAAVSVYDGRKAAKAAADVKPKTFSESDFTEEDDDDDLFCEDVTLVEAEVFEEQEPAEELPPRDKNGKFVKKGNK